MNSNWELPATITTLAKNYFDTNAVIKGQRLIKESRISISFSKGKLNSYYIVSGIVADGKHYESKVVHKVISNDEIKTRSPITSRCDCISWNTQHHCAHVAGLFLIFNLKELQQTEGGETSDQIKDKLHNNSMPIYPTMGLGVTPKVYGTLITSPQELIGPTYRPTYSAIHYTLTNGQVKEFPIPNKWSGTLLIDFEYTDIEDTYPEKKFAYLDKNGNLHQEITLLENQYLFNWRNGQAFYIPSELKILINKLKVRSSNSEYLGPNQLLREFGHDPVIKNFADILFDGESFQKIKAVEVSPLVVLNPGAKKGLIEFALTFIDENKIPTPIPDFLKAFTFEGGGFLGSFKKKRDAYEFLHSLRDSVALQTEGYKLKLLTNSRKSTWHKLIEHTRHCDKTLVYKHTNNTLYEYSNYLLMEFLLSLLSSFGELAFRFANHDKASNTLTFQINSSALYQGLNQFNQSLLKHSIEIFYGDLKVEAWRSKINFERRSHATNWFDLELNISKEDLEVIKNAQVDNGVAMTSKGLILLGKEEKNLLRFMQKYTKYETVVSTNDDTTEGQENKEEVKYQLSFKRSRIFELFELKKLGIDGALTEEENKICERLLSLSELPQYEVPAKLDNILRPYQKTAYHWLRFLYECRFGACLADDMGLGKTLQTITLLEALKHELKKVLVVCPVSILINWQNEIKKFTDLDCAIYHGQNKVFPENAQIILTSYGVMKREASNTFAEHFFDILILDEVHHLKNIRSLGANAARQLNANFRISLTGTPVENDLSEFYNILDISIPGIWGDLKFVTTSSNKKSRLLARKTAAPFILRRTKDNVLTELPPKIENNVVLNLSEAEKDNYQKTLDEIKDRILNSSSKRKYGEILKGLLQLRQNCLWMGPKKISKPSDIVSTKINFLLETLEQIFEEGHQAIVFSQFTTYLDMIQTYVEEKHWRYSRIDGRQTINTRQKQVETFQSGQNRLFLISLKAGGVGLNLTAASYVFIMDPWWNPAVESQAIDRAYRIGQKNTLTVYRPIIEGSVEEKIIELQNTKKQLFYDLLPDDDEELFSGKLNMNDFEFLLS